MAYKKQYGEMKAIMARVSEQEKDEYGRLSGNKAKQAFRARWAEMNEFGKVTADKVDFIKKCLS